MTVGHTPDGRLPGELRRGEFRVWLGYAAGVGKTYTMLSVGHRLADRGQVVVVGYVETHGRPRVQALLDGLEAVPRRQLPYQGRLFEEMDLDAVLAHRPEWAVVDELAHTNIPGSRNQKRWQDVETLLDAGISVLSTVNIQHLESLNDTVEQITGVRQRETVPDSVVRAADQIDLVDVAPDTLRRRLARGDIYPAEMIDAALANYFREGNLTALRELALMWLADRVDEDLLDYMKRHQITGPWETRERLVVGVTGKQADAHLIRRAARMAYRRGGDFLTVHVTSDHGLVGDTGPHLGALAELTRDLGGTFHEVVGGDVADALLEFSRAEGATQLVMGASSQSRWRRLLGNSTVNRVVRRSGPIDVHIISEEGPRDEVPRPPRRPVAVLPRRRRALGLVAALGGGAVLTPLLVSFRGHIGLSTVLLAYLCLVVSVALVGGWQPALVAAVGLFVVADWYFVRPLHRLTVDSIEEVVALVSFVLVAGVVSWLVAMESRHHMEAEHGRAVAEALAHLAGSLAHEDDPLPGLVEHLHHTFGLEGASVLRREGRGWQIEAAAGPNPPRSPEVATLVVPLSEGVVLTGVGPELSADDQVVLEAFAAQLLAAFRRRELAREAALAAEAAGLNELREAMLNAVSHDLRTPLASIKASVSSLRQRDVTWSEENVSDFLAAIEEGTDRLDWLVGNILDMSRLQAGALALSLQAVGLEEVVPRALRTIPLSNERVVMDVPENLARVRADPALLERVVANVVENAISWSPSEEPVRVQASEAGERVELRVVDRGPGIPHGDRERVFQPFQRLGDRPRQGGLGLGLAVARGFVEAMGGRVEMEDTPGGGLTVVISLEAE